MIVERVTGSDLHSYLSSSFFVSLRMESTAVDRENVDADRPARRYPVYPSASDLHRWMLVLERHAILGTGIVAWGSCPTPGSR